jgi:4-hydroxybenzoate polyprenyltransferase
LSGGLRLYLAFILTGLVPNISLILAASLIIYSTYTLDRSLDSPEDLINHEEFCGASRKTGLFVSAIAILFGFILFFSKNIYFPPMFPFVVGILYSRGLSVGTWKVKLKGGTGIKNLVIGITWGGTIGLIIASTGHYAAALALFVYFGLLLFINSAIFDLKDVKGDLAAGITTLPVVLGEGKLKVLLALLCTIQHLVLLGAMMGGVLVYNPVFFLYSGLAGSLVIICYTPAFEVSTSWIYRNFRTIIVDGESLVLVLLSTFLPY